MSLQSSDTDIPSYKQFIEFIQFQVKLLERTGTIHSSSKQSGSTRTQFKTTYKTFAAHDANEDSPGASGECILCKSTSHTKLFQCPKFLGMESPQARFQYIKSKNACVNCLSVFHTLSKCKAKSFCLGCLPVKMRHHSSLCRRNSLNNAQMSQAREVTCNTASADSTGSSAPITHTLTAHGDRSGSNAILSTAQVIANHYDNKQKIIIRSLLDCGSEQNLLTYKCCKLLNLPITPLTNAKVKGIGMNSQPIYGYVYINIASRVYPNNKYYIKALVLDRLTDNIPSRYVETYNMDYLKDLPLADLSWNQPGEVSLILGNQLFPHLYLGDKVIPTCTSSPCAILTTLGYVLSGNCNYTEPSANEYHFTALATSSLSFDLQKFWELDQINNEKRHLSPEEMECEKLFCESVNRDKDGRFSVGLPFCKDATELGNSYFIAHRRLLSLERKFKSDPSLRRDYNQVIEEYIQKGYLSEVLEPCNVNEGYYIPHHAVVRPEKSTSRVRIVNDASAKTLDKNVSLNDILHTGPNLQADLFLLLLNFRLFPVAMTADIKQMYLQIGTLHRDRKYLKILFRFNEDEKIRTYNYNRVPFGLKSSPYLAMRSVRQLCTEERDSYPDAAKVAESQLYMDDLVHSAPSEHNAKHLSQELIDLFKSGAFDLVKWTSNSQSLLNNLPDTHRASVNFTDGNNASKVLGLSWDPNEDTFRFTVSQIDEKCTKRTILSLVARLFDVLGLVAPVILNAKLIIKELWLNKIDWDDIPNENIIKRYTDLVHDLSTLSRVKIPRHIGVTEGSQVRVVAFADACFDAFGTVIYLHITDALGHIYVNLLCSKSKVSPTKITTIARLELCAALLMSKLVKNVTDTYSSRIPIEGTYAFSDSTIALSWIKSSPHRWDTFVSNRVAQCHENLPPQHFYHVAGVENPSDCLSRGVLPSQLLAHPLWWNGPAWLQRPPSEWPISDFSPMAEDTLPEYKSKALITTEDECDQPAL